MSGARAAIAAAPSGDPLGEGLAQAIARHLIGEEALPAETARWREAVGVHGASLERESDQRLWTLLMRRPALIGVVDAGLALADPHSPIRHRLFLMLAVLEASPRHTPRFLSQPFSRWALPALALRMAIAALRSVLGLILVTAYRTRFR